MSVVNKALCGVLGTCLTDLGAAGQRAPPLPSTPTLAEHPHFLFLCLNKGQPPDTFRIFSFCFCQENLSVSSGPT